MKKKYFLVISIIVLCAILFSVLALYIHIKHKDNSLAVETIENFFKGRTDHDEDLTKSTLHYVLREHDYNHPEIESWDIVKIVKISSNRDDIRYSDIISDIRESFYAIKVYKVKHVLKLKSGYNIFNSQIAQLANSEGIWWYFILVKEKRSENWMIYNYGY